MTLDQFFDELQFESSRRRGRHAVETICQSSTAPRMTFGDFLACALAHAGAATTGRRRWRRGSSPGGYG